MESYFSSINLSTNFEGIMSHVTSLPTQSCQEHVYLLTSMRFVLHDTTPPFTKRTHARRVFLASRGHEQSHYLNPAAGGPLLPTSPSPSYTLYDFELQVCLPRDSNWKPTKCLMLFRHPCKAMLTDGVGAQRTPFHRSLLAAVTPNEPSHRPCPQEP